MPYDYEETSSVELEVVAPCPFMGYGSACFSMQYSDTQNSQPQIEPFDIPANYNIISLTFMRRNSTSIKQIRHIARSKTLPQKHVPFL